MFNVASSLERKNPRAAIEAFKQAFGDDPNTRLVVKYSNASAFPQALRMLEEAAHGLSNIVFIGNTMNTAEVDNLYAQADVVLSLHRAEGFGLVVAEAMLRGIPVIATNWSGNTDFLTRETGVPIGYRLIPAHDPQDTYNYPALNWADADVREAAEALRMLRADPDLCKRLGAAAMEHASQLFSPRTYGEMVKRLLSVSRSEPRG
jgi:glycosyltransferase involved in cell wall biosynthesis